MAGDHARSIPDLRGRPSPDLPRFTPCRRREQAFELTQPGVRHTRFLIHDRDSNFPAAFDAAFRAEGLEVIRAPVWAPNANARCERRVSSVRRECLDWLLIVNRRHLEAVLAEYIEHYNGHRPHRSLELRPPRG